MTSVFCLHLHNRSEGGGQTTIHRGGGGEEETQDGCWSFCVGAAALEPANSGASDETVSGWNKTALQRTFDLVWAVSGQTAEAIQRGKFNKRRVKS